MVSLEQLLAACLDGLLAVDAQGVVTSANDAARRMLQVPLEGRRLEEVFELTSTTLDAPTLVRVKGQYHHRCRVSPLRVGDGVALFVRSRLGEYQARVQELTVNATLLDMHGVIIEVNEAFARTLGYTRDEMRGTHFMQYVHREDLARLQKERLNGRTDSFEVGPYESRCTCRDGSTRWFEWHVRADPEEGLNFSLALDVTARHLATAELERNARMLRDAERIGHIGGWTLDIATQRVEWSDETYRIHDLPVGTPITLKTGQSYYAPEAQQLIALVCEEGMRLGTPWDLVLPMITSRGRRITVRTLGRPEYRDDQLVRLVGTLQDVTQQEQHKAELAAAHAAALDASRVKSRFLATMSHEMRTPLNGILGLTHLLADTPLEQNQRSLVEDTQACGEHLLNLVNDVLDIAKIEANKLELEFVPFAPHDVVREQLRPLQRSARPRGVTLSLDIDDGGSEPLVMGDPVRFGQVVLNLVSNAVKFTLQGTVHVSLARTREQVQLTVRDTGVGIPADRLDAIFNPFTQADSSTTRRFGGTGLGLAICKQLIERMRGTIAVDSRPGVGTTFRVAIPLTRVATHDLAELTPAPVPRAERPLRVLVAEDNEINARVTLRFLERLGHSGVHVADGRRALDAVIAANFDVVLMDVNMPVMDGLEATRRIRELEATSARPALPIVALTANAMKGDADLCRQVGMNAHLTKPLREHELAETLAAVMQGREALLPPQAESVH